MTTKKLTTTLPPVPRVPAVLLQFIVYCAGGYATKVKLQIAAAAFVRVIVPEDAIVMIGVVVHAGKL